MKLQTIIYVTDMVASVAFYESLGLNRRDSGEPDEHWNQFVIGDAALSLHLDDPADLSPVGRRAEVWLVLPVDGTLDALHASLSNAGEIADTGFGRHFATADPDGQPVFIMENPGA